MMAPGLNLDEWLVKQMLQRKTADRLIDAYSTPQGHEFWAQYCEELRGESSSPYRLPDLEFFAALRSLLKLEIEAKP